MVLSEGLQQKTSGFDAHENCNMDYACSSNLDNFRRVITMKGLVHIYTGNGKGKTTAALGLGVRACGSGMSVMLVQFLKSAPTSELKSLELLDPPFRICRKTGSSKFTWDMDTKEKERTADEQREMLRYAAAKVENGEVDMLILDEIMGAITSGMLDLDAVVDFIKTKPDNIEVIMTGRNAPSELIELADYVSEINEVKHPAQKGIMARKGIEY